MLTMLLAWADELQLNFAGKESWLKTSEKNHC